MTAQHTPGPWQLDELGIIYSGDCTELCDRHSNEHVVAIVTDARPEDRRLIAAAPLMLEALRAMTGQYIAFVSQGAAQIHHQGDREEFLRFHAERTSAALAAIRAATGEDA